MQKRFLKTLLVKSALVLLCQLNFSFSQNNGSVYGFVTDSSNGEALIGANVFITNLALGMATDINGYYEGVSYERYVKDPRWQWRNRFSPVT